jgi:hypothetical protein
MNECKIKPSPELGQFLVSLSQANIVTRYPEDLNKLKKIYSKKVVSDIINKTKETILWIKKSFK